ncbi:CAP domain-containing protein [bacterium]|nr:CAP domain-containing protein [bacterium]
MSSPTTKTTTTTTTTMTMMTMTMTTMMTTMMRTKTTTRIGALMSPATQTCANRPTRPVLATRRAGLFIALALLAFGCAALAACDDSGGASESFAVKASDAPLACDPEGETPGALACRLAYYTNRERAAHPEESDFAAPLAWDADLAAVARDYSERMCDEGFFDHVDPKGASMEMRLMAAGISYVKAGENLARGRNMSPKTAVEMFMDEPSCRPNHRANVLDPEFTHVGVGVAFCRGRTVYTQLFARYEPRSYASQIPYCFGR